MDAGDDIYTQAGAHILMGSKELASNYLDKMSEEQLVVFKTYTTYTIYEQLRER